MLKKLMAGAVMGVVATATWADGDVDAGKKVFRKCKSCHAVGEGAKNKVGPALNGIINAAAGANPDFKYSDGMKAKAEEGLIWDEANLAAYLTKPKDVVPKTKMSFPGLKKEEDIANVLAYLATFP